MVMDVKYSVIIPVYNSEKTIERCLKSLLDQNRADVQIIAVDDGSRDRSGEIIRSFPGVEYVYQENAGVSCARNRGLDRAKGTYVTFVDSDDFVEPDYFEVMDRAGDCDLLVFAHRAIGRSPDVTELFEVLDTLDDSFDRLKLLLSSRRIMSPWDKRFRREIIEKYGIRFIPGMHIGEDFNFCMAYAMHSASIKTVREKILVFDVSNENSLSRKYRPHLDDQLVWEFESAARTIRGGGVYEKQSGILLRELDYLFIKHLFSCVTEEIKGGKLDHRRLAEICGKFRTRYGEGFCGMVHRGLRMALTCRAYVLFYAVSYLKLKLTH